MTAPFPESVPLSAVPTFFRRLGVDPRFVQALELGTWGMYLTLLAKDADGRKLFDGRDAATHRIFVRFDEEVPDGDPPAGRGGSAAGQS